MKRALRVAAALAIAGVLSACATAAGGLIGGGIGMAAGDTTAGVMIGSGIGMMIDLMD